MTTKRITLAAALLALASAFSLHAQQPAGPVETRLEATKVVRAADGKEATASAEAAKPGDTIEYAATYRNRTRQAVRNLEATLPIPNNTEYLPGSARPANAKASVDGRAFADMPLKRKVVRDGKEVEEQVPLREYRYLRWYPGELAGEQALSFNARVRVLEDVPPRESGKGGGK
jgi:uncharacterized repeat protein (TIGR01451 family)